MTAVVAAFSFGGSGPQVVVQSVRNRAVLDALVTSLGGANFEYDQVQWRGWLAAQAKATAVDVRRDPLFSRKRLTTETRRAQSRS